MRLFTAVVPPADAVAEVVAALSGPVPEGWRLVDPATWHLTLAFHGEVEPAGPVAALDRVAELPAPRLRVDGAGRFPGVRWARVVADPPAALTALVAAVGGDPDAFVPHLTLLRRRGRRRVAAPRLPPLAGPWWEAREVVLMASELRAGGPVHTPVHRVVLAGR
ncbi:2'-5' RNA ligase family protein [Pseudonocardia sp. CA-107938]|uniref:2'-5' RNA ligase family protein n=1 Tax=Pseudonocardia sp. CA-107938 TaxID=3240021 RepID=UPI003D926141